MAKHIHADLMLQYAQDAMETDKPWERWELFDDGWYGLTNHPVWHFNTEYRRKPKMLSVTLANSEVVSWPEPVRENLKHQEQYFVPSQDGHAICDRWFGTDGDIAKLAAGLVHLDPKAAAQHAAAFLKINNQGLEP